MQSIKNQESRIKQGRRNTRASCFVLRASRAQRGGFTLIETLVAVSLLTVAIVAPMALAAQSLASAYYARDQVTAYYLAQEAIEAVRSIRDSQILQIAQNTSGASLDIFGPIPHDDKPFRVDARQPDAASAIVECSTDPGGVCPRLQTDGALYGYDIDWQNTNFTRTVTASSIGSLNGELRITVTVTWQTKNREARVFTISSNLYRWVTDGSGA